jgi:uncharacterized RDD family membrane protein YckC
MNTPHSKPSTSADIIMDANLVLDRRKSYFGNYAGFASRLIAFIVDIIVISIVLVASGWFIHTSLDMLGIVPFLYRLFQNSASVTAILDFLLGPVFGSFVSLIFIFFYYIFFWMAAGQTPGKYLMGVKVVALNYRKLRFRHAFLRYIGYFISGLALGLGYFWILVDDERRGWHDRIANTCVIYTWDARPDEAFLVRLIDKMNTRRTELQEAIARRRHKD